MSSFAAAVDYVDAQPSSAVATATKLKLYGLYKTATTGATSPTSSRPAFFDLQGRAKWDAWKACAAVDAEDAQERYEVMARELGYGAESSERKAAVKGNISVSTMTLAGEEGPGSRLHDLAAEGDLAGLRAAIANADPSDFDARDHYGNTLMHVAADRGRLDVLRFLLERGADSAALDADGQTPLEAAELAEQTEVVTLLKERRIEDNAR